MKRRAQLIVFILLAITVEAQVSKRPAENLQRGKISSLKGKLLYSDKFDHDLKNWAVEFTATPGSSIEIKNQKLVVDVDAGATVWFRKILSGNIMITYKRKVIMENGRNDRLSDLNQFWMAGDPKRENLFTRTGEFSQYDSLQLYYAGIGGNSNTTSRFRKYMGNGDRVLHFDLNDKKHLLEANKEYGIKIIVNNGITTFYVDDKQFFSFEDKQPLKTGYFGFRTTQSRQQIDDFKVYQLK